MPKTNPLSKYIDDLQTIGRYTFQSDEVIPKLGVTDRAFHNAARRMARDGKIVMVRKGFYVIVTPEYRNWGILPAPWFIDDLMKFHRLPYYVGLLSAAALHGSAHQQPQVFQVLTTIALRPIHIKGMRIGFYTKSLLESTPIQRIKTTTGYIPVSTPEATAIDLVRYSQRCGGLEFVATIIADPDLKMKPVRLYEAAQKCPDLPALQRLGYILETSGRQKLADALHARISPFQIGYVKLASASQQKPVLKNHRWRLLIRSELDFKP